MNNKEGIVLPLLPLRGVVVFPHMVIPLLVGRPKSMLALEKVMVEERQVLFSAQLDETIDDPEAEDVYKVGTVGEVKQLIKLPDGSVKIIVEGLYRAQIEEFIENDDYLEVKANKIEEDKGSATEILALMRLITQYFEEIVKIGKRIPVEVMINISNIEDGGRLADILVTHLNIKVKEQQSILESFSYNQRLEKLFGILEKELEILTVEKKIESRIRKQVEKTQKEYYLREQMRAIREELGNDDEDSEIASYKKKINSLNLSEEIHAKVSKELERLAHMPSMSAEAVVVRNYLDCIIELPWVEESEDHLDIEAAKKILDEDHYGLDDVKNRIIEYLAVRQLSPDLRTPIFCLVGAPGVGKTSLARSIARALGKKFLRISLGGVRDEAEIRGHRRTYVGSRPGRIINAMRNAGVKNPIFLLDEIDKMNSDFRGDPASALLEVLDPEQNFEFSDHYLEIPFDLSKVMFITTANVEHTIPPALLDRMEIIHLSGYTGEEKIHIAQNHLIPRQLKEHALKDNKFALKESGLQTIITRYTREAGVRTLERNIAALMRKVARAMVEGKIKKETIDEKNVTSYLGPPLYRKEETREELRIGVATGMAYTESGGDLLDIEVTVVEGKGKLILTGHLGDVMKESAQAALTYARSRQETLNLPNNFYLERDIHIHVPQGAIPKDGPSAGITIAIALISALSNKEVPGNVAMTGEITLRGRILPVGGIKTKILAAHRVGIKDIILPLENEPQLKDIPDYVRKELKIKLVSHMDEALEHLIGIKGSLKELPLEQNYV